MKTIDILCVGEVLIDFIGHEINKSIKDTKNYHRFLGGSPTNVAVNAAQLGLHSVLVATCGTDGLGNYIVEKLQKKGVDCSALRQDTMHPTSVILVSKSTSTPDFVAYRQADAQILESQLSEEMLSKAKIFHTTCFALSKNPAQHTIIIQAKKAQAIGLQTSIDINYSEKIWPNKEEAKAVIASYLETKPLVKLSEDDCLRWFEGKKSEAFIFDYFHAMGAKIICYTKGKDGVVVSEQGKSPYTQPAIVIDAIKDTTGAGDAFWTGFLFGQITYKSVEESIILAQKLAAIKLQSIGQLPEDFKVEDLVV